MEYLKLTDEEIARLKNNQCFSETWNEIEVAEGFDTDNLNRCELKGRIRIGRNVRIKNVGLIEMRNVSAFGNGTEVTLMDESGSRAVRITDKTNAQTAYIECFWRSDKSFIDAYRKMTDEYVKQKTSDRLTIGDNVEIRNCREIRNVRIEEGAKITGVSLLENGTVMSTNETPTEITHDVIARDFIVAAGAKVTYGAQIERCYVGENSVVGEQFAATDTVVCSNCQMMHGESAALLAGPFSVSHHKSTLLIAASVSMFNAGSGSNQSNHAYKSGPIHYGVIDRGCKMGSDSYMAWPGRTGAFSVILGKHKNKINAEDFPFSYLTAEGMSSRILPGLSLKSFGTYRDVNKWKSRDTRTDEQKRDIVNFSFLSPYVIEQMKRGIKRLAEFLDTGEQRMEILPNITINRKSAERGYDLYNMALDVYLGMNATEGTGLADEWTDINGMTARRTEIEELTRKVAKGDVLTLDELQSEMGKINSRYNEGNRKYATKSACEAIGKESLDEEDLKRLRKKAQKAAEVLKRYVIADAGKEFSGAFKWNFGVNQNEESKKAEFDILRGKADEKAVGEMVAEALRL